MLNLLRYVLRGFEALGGEDPEADPEPVEVTDLDGIRITVPEDLIPQFQQVEAKHADEPQYYEPFTWELGAHGLRQIIDIARESKSPDDAMLTIYANTRFPRTEDGNIDFDDGMPN